MPQIKTIIHHLEQSRTLVSKLHTTAIGSNWFFITVNKLRMSVKTNDSVVSLMEQLLPQEPNSSPATLFIPCMQSVLQKGNTLCHSCNQHRSKATLSVNRAISIAEKQHSVNHTISTAERQHSVSTVQSVLQKGNTLCQLCNQHCRKATLCQLHNQYCRKATLSVNCATTLSVNRTISTAERQHSL